MLICTSSAESSELIFREGCVGSSDTLLPPPVSKTYIIGCPRWQAPQLLNVFGQVVIDQEYRSTAVLYYS